MFRKLTLAVAMAGVVAASPAFALTVNVFDGAGGSIISGVTEFDYNSGSTALAIGKGPFGSDPSAAPNPFTFLYQSVVTAFNDANLNPLPNPIGLNSTFEFTVAARISEFAVITGPTSASFTPVAGTVSLFYDDLSAGVLANNVTGAGYTDGVEIARFSVVGGTSIFTVISPNSGLGATDFDFSIVTALDFVDANYLQGVTAQIGSMTFQSTQNFPPIQVIPNQYFNGSTVAPYPPYAPDLNCAALPCDLAVKVDGSSRFDVPEPGVLSLLALGLLGLGVGARRSRKA